MLTRFGASFKHSKSEEMFRIFFYISLIVSQGQGVEVFLWVQVWYTPVGEHVCDYALEESICFKSREQLIEDALEKNLRSASNYTFSKFY